MKTGLEVDEKGAQQFMEQPGPGRRPLWAVAVVLKPQSKALVMATGSEIASDSPLFLAIRTY